MYSNQNDLIEMPPQEAIDKLIRLCNQGQFQIVFELTQILLKHYPKVFIFWNIFGISASRIGNHDIAIQAYKNSIILNPNSAETHFNMGIIFKAQGKLDDAVLAYKNTLLLEPNHANAYTNLSIIFCQQGKIDEAIKGFKKAITIAPNNTETYNNMGIALRHQGKLKEAADAYEKAISLKPDYAEAHNNIGVIFRDVGKLEESIVSFKRSISLEPYNANFYNNMGISLQYQGKLDQAIDAYYKSISYKPDYAYAFNNLAGCLKEQGKFQNALNIYDKALSIKPDYSEAIWNSSLIYNLKGNLEKGLKLYEWRLKKKNPNARLPRDHLIWDGIKSISGKRFFVYEEQGLGDKIQFCRYLLLLKQKGAEVTFRVKRKMHALLQTLDSNIALVESDPDEKDIDFEAPLMSLPYLFNTNLDTIPSSQSYLLANHNKVISWGKRLPKPTFKIGICWQGDTSQSAIGRSFPLSLFEDISKLSNVELISLHKGEGEKQIKVIKFDLTTFGNDFDSGENSFIDTAAVMMNCDLIISCDTSIAHLAGALGCPIWVALKKIPEWRWMLDRTDSPWYPNMRLYRQKEFDDWQHVFETMENDLVTLIKQEKSMK